jgi:hypothetical protein
MLRRRFGLCPRADATFATRRLHATWTLDWCWTCNGLAGSKTELVSRLLSRVDGQGGSGDFCSWYAVGKRWAKRCRLIWLMLGHLRSESRWRSKSGLVERIAHAATLRMHHSRRTVHAIHAVHTRGTERRHAVWHAHWRSLMAVHCYRPTLSHVVHHRSLRSLESLIPKGRHATKSTLVILHMLHARWRLNLLVKRRAHLMWWLRSLRGTLLHERPRAIR